MSASEEKRVEQLERENAALRQENAGLRVEQEKLRREIEEWKRGFRERGKRRTSRAENRERGERKKPGRKEGHPAAHRPTPEKVDHEKVHATPPMCPCCGGSVEQTDETVSTLEVDVPPVQPEVTRHKTVVGRCALCAARVVAPLPGASKNGTTVAPVTFGPNLQSIAVSMGVDCVWIWKRRPGRRRTPDGVKKGRESLREARRTQRRSPLRSETHPRPFTSGR